VKNCLNTSELSQQILQKTIAKRDSEVRIFVAMKPHANAKSLKAYRESVEAFSPDADA
jgi:hypothetical protein